MKELTDRLKDDTKIDDDALIETVSDSVHELVHDCCDTRGSLERYEDDLHKYDARLRQDLKLDDSHIKGIATSLKETYELKERDPRSFFYVHDLLKYAVKTEKEAYITLDVPSDMSVN